MRRNLKEMDIMRTPFIEGEKVSLAPLTAEDAKACYEWFVDPEIRKFVSSHALPNTFEKSRNFIEEMNVSNNDVLLGIFTRPDGEYIGNIALHGIDRDNSNAFFGIVIGNSKNHGKGMGTEAVRLLLLYAFRNLGLNMVFLNVFADNVRAIRSYEKLGFKKCGTLPKGFRRDGEFIDCTIMAVLASEFKIK